MENIQDITSGPDALCAKQKRECQSVMSKSIVKAKTLKHKNILANSLEYFLNQFSISEDIKKYCIQNSIDDTYLGIADGNLHKTLSSRHSSFKECQDMGLIDQSGKDCFKNSLVIPVMEGVEVTALKFVDLSELTGQGFGDDSKPLVLRINHDSFKVTFNHRVYILQGLVKSDHILKATVKFNSGSGRHVDVINFYSAGNRKRLIQDICETFRTPYEEVKADIDRLLEICEKQVVRPKLSKKAKELFDTLDNEKFTRADIEDKLLWNRMAVKRTLDELTNHEMISQASTGGVYEYRKI